MKRLGVKYGYLFGKWVFLSENKVFKILCYWKTSKSPSADRGSLVYFTNLSSNSINYEWDFGDGSITNYSNPWHEYHPGIYIVSLTVTNDSCDGYSIYSDTLEISPSITRIRDQKAGSVKVFPNPSQGSLFLHFQDYLNEKIELGIYDMNGKIVFQEFYVVPEIKYQRKLQLHVLSDGFYTLMIQTNDRIKYEKIIINK